MNLFFDLDGTILDSRERLYRLFIDLTGLNELTFNDYWNIKRNGIGHKQILMEQYGWDLSSYQLFYEKWMNLIEDEQYLKFDTLFPNILKSLKLCTRNNIDTHIITHRQSENNTIKQLDKLGITALVKSILVTNQKSSKKDLITAQQLPLQSSDYLVGDSGKDIECAKELGIQSVAVLSGFLNKEKLSNYHPDFIFETTVDFLKLIKVF